MFHRLVIDRRLFSRVGFPSAPGLRPPWPDALGNRPTIANV